MATFVLVPGGWQGGWTFDPVVQMLQDAGHRAIAVTLTGLEADGRSRVPDPNLDTHVEDVLAAVVEASDAASGRVVLCGHSYGGLPIAGAADRDPERVAGLVFIDAYVPDDGDSCWSLTSDAFRQLFVAGARRDGRVTDPSPSMDARARPHPMASFLQAVRITGAIDRIVHRHALWHTAWDGSPFTEQFERLRADRAWTVHELDVAHNIMRVAPDRLARVLVDVARSIDGRP